MSTTNLSVQFSFLTISEESPIDLEMISKNQKMLQEVPNAQFWCLAVKHFFKDQEPREFPSKKLVNFARKRIQPILFLNINVPFEKLPSHMQKLYKIGINLNRWQEEGFTLFHLAAITGENKFIKTAPSNTIDSVDKKGRTALHLSALFGNLEVAKKLIEGGANSDLCAPMYGSTLSQAILGGDPPTISFFKDLKKAKTVLIAKSPNILTSSLLDETRRLYYSKCYINPRRKEIFAKRINRSHNPELLKKYYDQEKTLRTFYHSWKIDWKLKTSDLTVPHTIYSYNSENQLEFSPNDGGYSPFFLHKMAKSTTKFATLFENSPNFTTLSSHSRGNEPGCLSILSEALTFAADQQHLPVSAVLQRIQSKMFTIVSIRLPTHAVNAVFCDRVFALCNRGLLTRKSIEIFYYDNTCLSEAILGKMLSDFESNEAYSHFFFTELKRQLRLYQLPMEKELEQLVAMPCQTSPNCAWESAETSSYMVFVLHALKQADLLNIKKFTSVDASKVITSCNYQFYNWLLFQQLEHLENYLAMTTAPNREFVSNHEMYLEAAYVFLAKKHSSWTHPYLLDQMLAIEKKYPAFTAFYKFLRF